MAKKGYLRVSTEKQDYARQLYVLKEYNLDKIYEEKISGTKKALGREKFNLMMSELAEGDVIYFESMSRMARSMQDLIDTTNTIVKQKKATVVFIKENLKIGNGDGTDAMSALVFNIMGAFAQFERDILSDRTKQALQAKKAQGVVLGRPETISKETKKTVVDLYRRGYTYRDIAARLNVSIGTISNIVNKKIIKK